MSIEASGGDVIREADDCFEVCEAVPAELPLEHDELVDPPAVEPIPIAASV
jgi:hypothetical protein